MKTAMGFLGLSQAEQIGAAIVQDIGRDAAGAVLVPWWNLSGIITDDINTDFVNALKANFDQAKADGYTGDDLINEMIANSSQITRAIALSYVKVTNADIGANAFENTLTTVTQNIPMIMLTIGIIAGLYFLNKGR